MANRSISEFAKTSDSVSLTRIGDKPFSIAAVEDSPFEDGATVKDGVKITTVESFEIDGKKYSKFHTTRTAIVSRLKSSELREALARGDTIGPVRALLVNAKKGTKPYYDLVEAK